LDVTLDGGVYQGNLSRSDRVRRPNPDPGGLIFDSYFDLYFWLFSGLLFRIRSRKKLASIIYNRLQVSSKLKMMQFLPYPALFIGSDILDLISNTGPVAKFVLLTLLAFSLISWAIILTKWSLLRRARLQSGRFMRAFRKAQRLQDIATVADQFRPSPLVGVFEGGFQEYKRQLAAPGSSLRSLTAVQRGMQIGVSEEITRLERNVPWLAITAAVTPFIGLFGTVWGIIDAFHGLGTAGGATLRAVAPGISEALITTAAGLAAAIPAVIAYNLIGNSIREFAARGDDFALEVLNAIETIQAQPAADGRR
jgi:biopolymer transport protein TolQ